MAKKQVWIKPSDEGWKVESAGAKRAYRVVPTKAEALIIGTQVAKNKEAELIIQKKNGEIQNSNSFGKDPCPPKDSK